VSKDFMAILGQEIPTALAQASPTRVLIWITVLIVLVIAGAIVLVWVRRSFLDAGMDDRSLETLSLHQLRQLHAHGRLSDEEFETLKDAAVQAHRGGSDPTGRPTTQRDDNLQARSGFDLTGEPLPGVAGNGGDQPGENPDGPDATPRSEA
jgi:hypothetical protein